MREFPHGPAGQHHGEDLGRPGLALAVRESRGITVSDRTPGFCEPATPSRGEATTTTKSAPRVAVLLPLVEVHLDTALHQQRGEGEHVPLVLVVVVRVGDNTRGVPTTSHRPESAMPGTRAAARGSHCRQPTRTRKDPSR